MSREKGNERIVFTDPRHTMRFLEERPNCICGGKFLDDGGCRDGCCSDYKCDSCGKRIRMEWPD